MDASPHRLIARCVTDEERALVKEVWRRRASGPANPQHVIESLAMRGYDRAVLRRAIWRLFDVRILDLTPSLRVTFAGEATR